VWTSNEQDPLAKKEDQLSRDKVARWAATTVSERHCSVSLIMRHGAVSRVEETGGRNVLTARLLPALRTPPNPGSGRWRTHGRLRATHTIGVAQCAPRRSLRSSHPAELAGRSCPHRWARSGLLHSGGLRRENRRRCHLIVTSTRTSTRKIVELRGFEPLTFCMPCMPVSSDGVAACRVVAG